MTSLVLLPALSEDGWTNSSIKTADYLLSHFFEAEYSQTYLYNGEITSLPYIIQNNNGNVAATISALSDRLANYFKKYFTSVLVQGDDVTNPSESSFAEINLYLTFTDNEGKNYSLGKLIHLQGMTITKIINISNG